MAHCKNNFADHELVLRYLSSEINNILEENNRSQKVDFTKGCKIDKYHKGCGYLHNNQRVILNKYLNIFAPFHISYDGPVSCDGKYRAPYVIFNLIRAFRYMELKNITDELIYSLTEKSARVMRAPIPRRVIRVDRRRSKLPNIGSILLRKHSKTAVNSQIIREMSPISISVWLSFMKCDIRTIDVRRIYFHVRKSRAGINKRADCVAIAAGACLFDFVHNNRVGKLINFNSDISMKRAYYTYVCICNMKRTKPVVKNVIETRNVLNWILR